MGNRRERPRVPTSQLHPLHLQHQVLHREKALERLAKLGYDKQQQCDDDGDDMDDDPSNSPADLAEVLTVTAKKFSGLTLARGWSKPKTGNPKDKNLSVQDTKKVTHCTAGGARGPWYQDPECPMNAKKFSKSTPSSQGFSPQPSTSYNMAKGARARATSMRFVA